MKFDLKYICCGILYTIIYKIQEEMNIAPEDNCFT